MRSWRRLLAAGGAALLAYVAAGCCSLVLLIGWRPGEGLLAPVIEYVSEAVQPVLGWRGAVYATTIACSLPSMLLALATYAWLTSPKRNGDGLLHCLHCGYILKGLSEPRCPECGQPI